MQQLANRSDPGLALPAAWVDRIFKRMSAMYGAKFSMQWADVPMKDLRDEWAELLGDYSASELSRGLDACKQRMFPPTLPEFMSLCRPSLVAEVAFQEAVRGMIARNRGEAWEWSHPAIFWAAVRVSSHEILSQGYATLRTRWENALRDVVAAGAWEAIPGISISLPAPARSDADRDEAARRMAQMGAAGILNSRGRDHKAWAHKILAKLKGKHSVSHEVAAMARRALGMEEP